MSKMNTNINAVINERVVESNEGQKSRRRVSVLVEFPDERFESVVIQWERSAPTVLIQLARNTAEPLQFSGTPPAIPQALDLPLGDFIDPCTARIFGKPAEQADVLLSARAFTTLQPEPDLVLPPEAIWECRTEALRALSIQDTVGIFVEIKTEVDSSNS